MSFIELQAGKLLQEQRKTENLSTSNYMQGPPPLISDQTKVQHLRPKPVRLNSNNMPTKTAGDSSLAGIPGVYFNYQLQQEEALLQLRNNDQLKQAPEQNITQAVSQEPEAMESEVVPPSEYFEPNQIRPPPLVSNKDWVQPIEEKITQQILSSTSKLLNFIQIRVLSSINASIGRKPSTETASKDIEILTPSNETISSPVNSNFEHNFLHDFQSRGPSEVYMNSTHIPMTTDSIHNTTQVFTPNQLKLDRTKRQKKTREEKLAYLRQYARERRARETPEQREARLADLRARQRRRKANETPEQRKLRLERDRLKTGRYRAKKRHDIPENGVIAVTSPYLTQTEQNGGLIPGVAGTYIRPTIIPFTLEQ